MIKSNLITFTMLSEYKNLQTNGTRIRADRIIRFLHKEDTMLYSEIYQSLEIKAAEGLKDKNKAQLINYLKATNKQVGLFFNFGKKPDFKRAIFSNERREILDVETQNPCLSAQSASSAFHSLG